MSKVNTEVRIFVEVEYTNGLPPCKVEELEEDDWFRLQGAVLQYTKDPDVKYVKFTKHRVPRKFNQDDV